MQHENLPTTIGEVRRRIMWSCVVMDFMNESGAQPVSSL